MEYTDKQYEMLGRLAGGLNWAMLPDEEMECVRYLIDQGLAQQKGDFYEDSRQRTVQGRLRIVLSTGHGLHPIHNMEWVYNCVFSGM